jgi:hypothetical protein
MTAETTRTSDVRVEDIEQFAADIDVRRAAAIYKEHGCLVVRGLMQPYIADVSRDIEAAAAQSIALLDQARQVPEGWVTPNGTLFLPAPPHFTRDKQIMVLAVSYYTSAAFFHSALDPKALDLMEAILGPNVELYMNGQCLYKEPVGGHPKHLHQDAAYFEHRYEGPVGMLSYVVDTDLRNGALYVAPGSHKMGMLKHIDTFSHLGLNAEEWPWERALPIVGKAGDAVFFHVKTVHGSQENHSEKPRPVIINRYRAADDYVVIQGTTAENRGENEKRSAEAKKENQRGLMVRGFRAYEPDHV